MLPVNQNIKNSSFHAVPATPIAHVAKHHRHKKHKHNRCHTHACYHRMAVHWRKMHPLGTHYTVSSTCYEQSGLTASGEQTHPGIVAVMPGFLPLGTWIELDHPAFGRRRYQVEDHIGEGSELDIFNESQSACNAYGRQQRGFRVVP
jgi:3D (Asp-Asp-Asp) domain-containing protein